MLFRSIPDYLIPEAMKEWGMEPKCLEMLVSEDIKKWKTMRRVTTTILPDTGCGVDNLETILAKDEIDLESQWRSDSNEIAAGVRSPPSETGFSVIDDSVECLGLQYPIGDDELRLETIFGLEDGPLNGKQFKRDITNQSNLRNHQGNGPRQLSKILS